MARALRLFPVQTSPVAVIILALAALACLASFAHAAMGTTSGMDCFGPACPQQITCPRADLAPAPPSKPLAESLEAVGSSVAAASLPQGRTLVLAQAPAVPSRRSVSPLASRSPPAA